MKMYREDKQKYFKAATYVELSNTVFFISTSHYHTNFHCGRLTIKPILIADRKPSTFPLAISFLYLLWVFTIVVLSIGVIGTIFVFRGQADTKFYGSKSGFISF